MNGTVKTIANLKRLKNTVNGNPRYIVTFTDGTSIRTQGDSMLGYSVENPEYRDVPLKLEVNGRGTLSGLEPVPFDQAQAQYVDREFGGLIRSEIYQVKVVDWLGNGATKWLNIDHEKMIAIRDIIAGRI
jgi:hypothetical protein